MPKTKAKESNKEQTESLYDIELKNQLSKDPWLRHLFNKIGKYVVAVLKDDKVVEGRLASIEFLRGYIRIEIQDYDATHFLDFRNIIDLKVLEGEHDNRRKD